MSQFVVEEQGADVFVAGGMGEIFLHRRPAIINLKCRDEGAFERVHCGKSASGESRATLAAQVHG